jgi:murein DD-endopeptidase MepM/ murein hydrolase activator NlpD
MFSLSGCLSSYIKGIKSISIKTIRSIKSIKRLKECEINKTWFFITALFILTITATVFFIWQERNVNQPSPNQIQVLSPVREEDHEVEPTSTLVEPKEVRPLPQSIPDAEDIVPEKALEITEDVIMKWPGQGDIIGKFGFGYSETFNDLRFHSGIDIALPPGYEVRAALPGTVTSISSSPMWGYEIVIKHGDKLETRYKGIKPLKEKSGYQVAKGDIIGQLIHSPKYEAKMKPHLHFEVYEFGKAVDPMEYLY